MTNVYRYLLGSERRRDRWGLWWYESKTSSRRYKLMGRICFVSAEVTDLVDGKLPCRTSSTVVWQTRVPASGTWVKSVIVPSIRPAASWPLQA